MAKNRILMLVAAALVLSAACKNKNDVYSSPEKVMEKFSVAFVTADFDDMYKYSVPHDAALIRSLQKYMRNNPEKLKEMNEKKVEVTGTTCEYVNDSLAVCKCDFLYDKEKASLRYRVKKEDGKWLVDVTED